MINAPSEIRCSEIPAYAMTTKVIASTSGIAIATTRPARSPRLRKLIARTITTASKERFGETRYSLLDDHWLIRHQMDPNPDRQVGHDLRHFLLQSLAELQEVRAGLHSDRERDGRLTVEANQGHRRIGVAARDGGDIGQRKKAIVAPKIDPFQVCLRGKLTVDPHADALRPDLEHAR